jgi:predicted molibdopterin-dependent oxidoreductase YjgC
MKFNRNMSREKHPSTEKNYRLQSRNQDDWVVIYVDGEGVKARAGETLSAALLASGFRTLRHTYKFGEPRGMLCGMGMCYECLVTVNDQLLTRACITLVEAGMQVETEDRWFKE